MHRGCDRFLVVLCGGVLVLGPLLVSPWGYDHARLVKESFLLLAGGTGAVFLGLLAASTGGVTALRLPLARPIACLVLVSVLSLTQAVNLPAAFHRLGQLLAGMALFTVASSARMGPATVGRLAAAAVGTAVATTGYLWLQWLGADPLFPPAVGLTSTLGNPNFYAEYAVAVLPLCLGLLLSAGTARGVALFGGAFVVIAAGLFTSQAKGAILAFIGSLVLFGFLWRRASRTTSVTARRRLAVVIFGVLVLAGVFGAAAVARWGGSEGLRTAAERYLASRGVYFRWRLVFAADTVRMAAAHPWLGVGIGNFQQEYPRFRSMPESLDPKEFILDHAHNDYLEICAELGIGGVLAVLWIGAAFFGALLRRRDLTPLDAAFGAAVGGLLLNSLFAFGLYNPVPLAFFWLLMGLGLREAAPEGLEANHGSQVKPGRPPGWTVAGAFLVLSGLGYAAFRPLAADALLARGYVALAGGWPAQALTALEKAARLSPARLESQVHLSQAYAGTGRPADALAVLRQYLRYDPYNFQVYYLLGVYLEQAGDDAAALLAHEDARRIYPQYSRPLLRIGAIWERRSDPVRAMAAYREALRLNPDLGGAANRLAVLLSTQGQTEEALRVWEDGARRNPDDPVLPANLARAYRLKGEPEKAAAWEARARAADQRGGHPGTGGSRP